MTVQLAAADAFDSWTSVADTVRGTTKRLQKLAALADYLPSLHDLTRLRSPLASSRVSVFPRHDARTTQVGSSILWNAFASLTSLSDESLAEAYGRYGDVGDMVGDVEACAAALWSYPRLARGPFCRTGTSHWLGGSP